MYVKIKLNKKIIKNKKKKKILIYNKKFNLIKKKNKLKS